MEPNNKKESISYLETELFLDMVLFDIKYS